MTHTAERTVAQEGERVTTRYFGGYEGVKVIQVHETYYVISRFNGAVSDILPKESVEKIFDAENNEIYSVDRTGLHPALTTEGSKP